MAEKDALSSFDFSKVTNAGLFLRFQPGESVTVRVLTIDPIIAESEFTDKRTGEVSINTRIAFIVYNFTDNKAQIMRVTPNTARKIGEIHTDPDFGSNIKKLDLKITPPNKNEVKAYDIQVLPNARSLTNDQIREAQAIDLDNGVADSKGRMSQYNQDTSAGKVGQSGYEKAKAQHDKLAQKNEPPENPDEIFDMGEEPFDLDELPPM
jgi:hypothetical protein